MGVVYKAFDPMIGRTVAVKTMRLSEEGSGLARPELVTRFQTEARAAGQLVHPNIVIIYDAGETEGLYYITMEYVEGRSLQALMDQKQPFPLPRILRIMGQVCSALEFAHQRNVVHRDVKPANIVLSGDDTVKITDFGTAKIVQLGTTQSGTIVGTPSYMSPEQIKGKPIDGRSDIFSLGVVLYELVTGEKPFPGESITTVIYKIVNEEPIPPRELDSSVHPGLSAVITRSLAKEPDARYQSCKELMQDLLNYRALGGGAPAGYDATVVVVGQRGQAPPTPPEQKPSGTGTLPGVPSLSAPPVGPGAPVDGFTSAAAGLGASVPPAASARQASGLRPLPGSSSLPSLMGASPEVSAEESGAPHSRPGLIAVLIVLLAIGGYLIYPTLKQVFFTPPATTSQPEQGEPAAGTAKSPEISPPPAMPPEKIVEEPRPNAAKPGPKAAAKLPKPSAPPATKPAVDPSELLARVNRQLAKAGFGSRVKTEFKDNVIRFSGALTPRDRQRLQQHVKRQTLPAGISVEYAFEAAEEASTELRPRPAAGKGEVEVLTDVSGAEALLTHPDGKTEEARTPWRFEDLAPGRYALEVRKEGYRTEKRILQIGQGRIKPVTITLQPVFGTLEVTSKPPGADILINGKAHAQQTPASITLPPGPYRVTVKKPGYEPFEANIRLEADDLKRIPVEFTEARRGIGFVEVRSIPPGADILINNTNTGKKTPERLQLPAGEYTLTIFMRGYAAVTETITVQPNQTLQVNKTLSR